VKAKVKIEITSQSGRSHLERKADRRASRQTDKRTDHITNVFGFVLKRKIFQVVCFLEVDVPPRSGLRREEDC